MNLRFICDGKRVSLNSALVKRQGLSQDQVNLIKKIHQRRAKMIRAGERFDNREALRELAQKLEQIELELQEAWGFEPNKYRIHWDLI